MKEHYPMHKFYKRLRLFMCGMVLLLLVASCGKKEANAAEITKDTAPPSTERQSTAAQPVAVIPSDTSTDNRRMTAIFTVNHADKSLDDKLPALEDFISSRITEKGFSVISREVATTAVSSL